MTKSYNKPEDFAADESFIRYCFHQNEKDVQFWEKWIRLHPQQQETIQKAVRLVESLAVKPAHHRKLAAWKKLSTQLDIQSDKKTAGKISKSRSRRMWQIAAAVVLLLISTGLVVRLLNHKTIAQTVYQTRVGESRQITLPDQTKVWLNAESKLIWQKNFKQSDKRAVTLIGEAFFKVQKDPARPFVIHANTLNIEVLGTAFNVRAYPRSATTSTTLISGAIQVSLSGQPEKKFRLQPKEKFTIENDTYKQVENKVLPKQNTKMPKLNALKPVFRVSQVDEDPLLQPDQILETAWMEGKLAFRNETFEELALQLSHKYGVQIHFEEDALKDYRFTGIFTKETLAEVLHALQLTSPSNPFTYRIENDKVFITK